jgi:two-component system, OmpR family, sensor histidine kinase CiaH
MKNSLKGQQLNILTTAFCFLLVYIVSGFIWWFVSLEKQNQQMYQYRIEELRKDESYYYEKVDALKDAKKRKTFQYIGEGSTFLLVILAGGMFVYWTARQQLLLSKRQQNFMMAVTHELKTPVAIIKLNIETILKRDFEKEKRDKLLSNSVEETKRLDVLISNILMASQLETNEYSFNKQTMNLSEMLHHSVIDFQNRYSDRVTTANISEDIFILGEYQLIQLLINNFLDNARKYSQRGNEIQVSLQQNNKYCELSFADQGVGIPDKEKKKIFDKFYRVGNEDTRKSKGTGLGLFLCHKIVTDHKGEIFVQDNQPQGTIFTIQLPLSKNI